MATDPGAVRKIGVPIPLEAFRTVHLEMLFRPMGAEAKPGDSLNRLAIGTGFFYRVDGRTYIVTARHNLTGRHWETNEFLSTSYSVEPTHLRVLLRPTPPPGGYQTRVGSASLELQFEGHLIPIVDEELKPTWLEHPDYGADMDVAAVPFENPDPERLSLIPWDAATEPGDDSKLWVTEELSIVGYPFGLTSGLALPLWIRGTVASETAFLYKHNGRAIPAFLVDARTRSGQSGSPVITFKLPYTLMPPPAGDNTNVRYTTSTYSRLRGVYTGRISPESDLGFVWHNDAIRAICAPPDDGVAEQKNDHR